MWIAATILGCLIIFLQKGIGDSFRLYIFCVLLLLCFWCIHCAYTRLYLVIVVTCTLIGDGSPVNKALDKPSGQSSTHEASSASYAVDGNIVTTLSDGCSQTEKEYYSWWYVDLESTTQVAYIKIHKPWDWLLWWDRPSFAFSEPGYNSDCFLCVLPLYSLQTF